MRITDQMNALSEVGTKLGLSVLFYRACTAAGHGRYKVGRRVSQATMTEEHISRETFDWIGRADFRSYRFVHIVSL
jgi:hypothetical protein